MKETGTLHTLLGVEIGETTLEGNVAVSIKILNNYDPALSFIRFHPWEVLVGLCKGEHTKMFWHIVCNMGKLGNKGKTT